MLNDLWWGGTGEILVVADDQQLSSELPRWRSEARHLGRRYHLARATVAGAFHPKLILRVGVDDGLVWIGSGNLTFGGWGANRELAAAWRVGRGHEDPGAWIRDLISALLPQLGRGAAYELALGMQDVGWIREGAAGAVPTPVLHSLGGTPLIEQLANRWAGRRFERALIYTGSSDRDGRMLEQLAIRFGVKEAQVVGSPGRLSFDPLALRLLPLSVRVRTNRDWPVLHAKFLWLDGPDGSACAFGSANASGAAWLRSPRSGGNAELIGVLDRPDAAQFAELLAAFEEAALTEMELGGTPPTEVDERVERRSLRLRSVEWDGATSQVTVELDGVTGDVERVDLEEGGRSTTLSAGTHGRWTSHWIPIGALGFVDVVVQIRGATSVRWTSWVHDLAELRHSTRGRTIEETLRKLGGSASAGEEQSIVRALADISSALISEPEAFRDAGSKRGPPTADGTSEDAGRVDPRVLIRSLSTHDRGNGPRGSTSSHAPVSLLGVLRALFLRHDTDTEVERVVIDEPEDGEIARPDVHAPVREHAAPSDAHRSRLRKQIQKFLKNFQDQEFAQRATASQMVQAAAFPLAVGLLGRAGGWVNAKDADDWSTAVFAILFERAGPEGRCGLFDDIHARFRASDAEDVFVTAVGDGTLWMALLLAIGGLSAEEPRSGLRRCLALQALQHKQTMVAVSDVGRMRALIGRMNVEYARRLQEDVPTIVEHFERLEAYLVDHELLLRAQQAAPEFEHHAGDVLWKSDVGWVECLEPAARESTARVFSHYRAREIPVKVRLYLNVSEAARQDRELRALMVRAFTRLPAPSQ